MDFFNIIPKLVSAFEIEKSSIVLLQFWGENKELYVLDRFALEIGKIGGIPIKHQISRKYMKEYFSTVSEENLNFPQKYFEAFEKAEVIVDICMYTPVMPDKAFPKDKMPYYQNYMRNLFEIISSPNKKLIQLRVPTEQNAIEAKLDFNIYKNALMNAYNINYLNLKVRCNNLINRLSEKCNVEIITSNNNKLTLRLNNRKWFKDDGTGDMPCGEIYIAPVEEASEGSILIPQFCIEDKAYTNIVLEFKNGRISGSSNKDIIEFFKTLPKDADLVSELGIGLNENAKETIGLDIFDEKCIDTAHLGFGMNTMFGGKNSCPFHMDLIFKPLKLSVDGLSIIENSKLAQDRL